MNIIVTGLPRSGTTMMMEILKEGGVPIAYDNKLMARYELEQALLGIMDNAFINQYAGKAFKTTCWRLKELPIGDYKIIFIIRDMEGIAYSFEKSWGIPFPKFLFVRSLEDGIDVANQRSDIKVLFIEYDKILENKDTELERIKTFLEVPFDKDKAKDVIDPAKRWLPVPSVN